MSILETSKIGLGTVEIGVPGYGVGNEGLVSEEEAIRLLKSAVELGVTYIDTARGYGVAEERIGKSGITKLDHVLVGTKCAQFLRDEKDLTGAPLEAKIRAEIDESRRLLGYETLPLVQLHIELPDYTNLDELIEIMGKLKAEEKVAHVGIASRGREVPLAAVESGFFETIQVAYSILDQRLSPPPSLRIKLRRAKPAPPQRGGETSVLAAAQQAGIGVINRSVLLQGALSPARTYLPDSLTLLKERADAAEAIAGELGISLPELAIRFALSHGAVSVALIGTIKPDRVERALTAAAAGLLPQEILDKLYLLAIDDPKLVDPGQWPK